jgi:hypothetical protein
MVQTPSELLLDDVIDEINRAFYGVTREGGVSLHEADVIDDYYGSMEERAEARKLDTETRWQDVPDPDIEQNSSILSFLDPIGFHYYIPAYMVWTLENLWISLSFSADSTIYALTLEGEDLKNWKLERFSLFNQEQAQAICQFLRYMVNIKKISDCDDAQKALDKY